MHVAFICSFLLGLNVGSPEVGSSKTKQAVETPDLKLQLHDGSLFSLRNNKSKFVFIYFYPKDDTPGCTIEAKGLRDHYADLRKLGVKVVGISLQDAQSHKKFIAKYKLPFPLAVDDGTAAKAFGVPVSGEFAARQSFLLMEQKVVKTWRSVDPQAHAKEVINAVKALL